LNKVQYTFVYKSNNDKHRNVEEFIMKILIGLIISAMTLGISSQVVAQTEVEVEWVKPEKYRDVRSSNESRKRFRENTFEHISEYMSKLALALPDNNKLLIKVSDLDLAGRVWPASFIGLGMSGADVRVVKSIDIPRINFSYQLLDTSGQVLQEAEVKLKDMSFLDRSNYSFRNEALRYEKNMLKRWFNQEFDYQIAKKSVNEKPINSQVPRL
jgi:N-acetyl-beta-hexosaminidase